MVRHDTLPRRLAGKLDGAMLAISAGDLMIACAGSGGMLGSGSTRLLATGRVQCIDDAVVIHTPQGDSACDYTSAPTSFRARVRPPSV